MEPGGGADAGKREPVERAGSSRWASGSAARNRAAGGSRGLSNRLVDAIVACGDEETVRARVQEHFDAGATHVSVQAIAEDDPLSLAPALLA